jgi:hypothetical protein
MCLNLSFMRCLAPDREHDEFLNVVNRHLWICEQLLRPPKLKTWGQ